VPPGIWRENWSTLATARQNDTMRTILSAGGERNTLYFRLLTGDRIKVLFAVRNL